MVMNSAAGDSCYFVVTIVGQLIIYFAGGVVESKSERKKMRQRADSCMVEERVISLCCSFSAALPLHLTPHLWLCGQWLESVICCHKRQLSPLC